MGQRLSRGQTRVPDRGDNVQVIISPSKSDRFEPPLKRQKLDSQRSTYNSADEPTFDPRIEGYTVTSQRGSREFSNRSLTPGTDKSADLGRGVGEFSSLENRMRTEPQQTRKARHRRSNNYVCSSNASATAGTLPLDSDPIQDTSEPEIQCQRVEPVPRSRYMGTARPRASNQTLQVTSDVIEQRESGQRSRYSNTSKPPRSHRIHDMPESFMSKRQEGHEKRDKTLDEKFVSDEGRRRSGGPVVDLNRMSPDELTGATTIGNNNVVRRHQSGALRAKNPVKSSSAQKGNMSSRNNAGLPRSNIPSTPFTHSKDKNDKKRSKHQTTYDGEKEASWSIDLEAISGGGEVHQSGTLGLVFNDETRTFDVHEDGRSLTTPYCDFKIHPKKIQKISHSSESSKVRIESSKCGKQDNTLDIQMRSNKDACNLVIRLANCREVKVVPCPRYVKILLRCRSKV